MDGNEDGNRQLTPYLAQLGAWAFSIGVAIGWDSLVVNYPRLKHVGFREPSSTVELCSEERPHSLFHLCTVFKPALSQRFD